MQHQFMHIIIDLVGLGEGGNCLIRMLITEYQLCGDY